MLAAVVAVQTGERRDCRPDQQGAEEKETQPNDEPATRLETPVQVQVDGEGKEQKEGQEEDNQQQGAGKGKRRVGENEEERNRSVGGVEAGTRDEAGARLRWGPLPLPHPQAIR